MRDQVPTNASECRKRAAYCVRLIRKTRDPHRKQELRQKAALWLRMAIEMERSQWPRSNTPKPRK
jgi:hypothetical protein